MLPKKAIICASLAVFAASGQGAAAFGASTPNPVPHRAAGIAAEQSDSASAGRELSLASGERLVVKDVVTDADGSTHVRYDRTYNGLRVIGGDLVSHQSASGRSESVSWNASHTVAVPSTTAKVGLSAAKAAGAGNAALSGELTASANTAELVVYADGDSPTAAPKLAYDVLTEGTRADQTPSRLHTVVDATTGVTLDSFDEIVTGTGNGLYVGTVNIGTIAGFTMRDAVGNYTTDLNGATSGTGTLFTDPDDIWGNGRVSDRASAAVDAQYGAETTFDYFQNVLGRSGIWNNGVGTRSRVHYGNGYNNAFWDGNQITYGDGAGNSKPLVELDVAAHEMSHGVTQATARLAYTGDAGGLNEGTSDIFGAAVEFYANNPSDPPDYLIGEEINVYGNGTPLRYMDRPSRDGRSRDCWSSTLGALDPHFSSGPLNHWFYLASEGSGAKVVAGVSYNSPTCNSSTVTAIGREAAAKIWYRTLSTYLTSNSDYAAARDGAIKSATDLYGAASPQCAGVAAAFSAIAVPAGSATCGTTSPPPPGTPSPLPPGTPSPPPPEGPPPTSTQPGTPTGAKATAGNSKAIVSWAAPAENGGSSITSYSVSANIGGVAVTTVGGTTATVSGLTNGTSYTFRVTATNAVGTSAASAPSTAVIPTTKSSDFSGDGRADVVAVKSNGYVYLYRGNGRGGFAGAATRIATGWGGFTKVFSPGDFSAVRIIDGGIPVAREPSAAAFAGGRDIRAARRRTHGCQHLARGRLCNGMRWQVALGRAAWRSDRFQSAADSGTERGWF